MNGRCCCLITFVLPSLRSGTWDVRTSSSLCSSAISHPSAHTVNGRYCCNLPCLHNYVNLCLCFNTVNGKHCCNQFHVYDNMLDGKRSFNTVNGKDCCNGNCRLQCNWRHRGVSIPWTVGAVATILSPNMPFTLANLSFNTASGRCCCNLCRTLFSRRYERN